MTFDGENGRRGGHRVLRCGVDRLLRGAFEGKAVALMLEPEMQHRRSFFAALVVAVLALAGLMALAVAMLPIRSGMGGGAHPPSVLAGIGFWVVLTLSADRPTIPAGGLRFSAGYAPMLTAAALGGPFVGGVVALLGATELRELRRELPWYAVVGNHVGLALPNVVAGLLFVVLGLTPASGPAFAVAYGGGMVIAVVGNFLIVEAFTGLTRGRVPARNAVRTWPASFGLGSVGWLMAEMMTFAGWWAAAFCLVPLVTLRAAYEANVLRAQNDELGIAARTDALTGFGNRLRLNEDLTAFARERRREGERLAFLLLDLDHFKALNDRAGHLAGDEALRRVADALRGVTRQGDRLYRYGGEEFLLVLGNCRNEADAARVAERTVGAVAEAAISHPANDGLGIVTASAGIAFVEGPGIERLDAALRDADAALYRAKEAGRNRTATAEPRKARAVTEAAAGA